ncbi:Detected protein of confused Function [Hibiscus syriacus]|uniref:Detected protein of confused Function n=1 Tax=Hibiscus syriacus TaxID=106335 RepID=A0A6A3A3R5_HIBSY|nr:Detected protein of confused Function [Hibiscus syriacus]
MNMKKISCAVIVAASMSAVIAADGPASAPGSASSLGSGPAPGPASSAAIATLPVLGSLVGATLVSFFSYYLQ